MFVKLCKYVYAAHNNKRSYVPLFLKTEKLLLEENIKQ